MGRVTAISLSGDGGCDGDNGVCAFVGDLRGACATDDGGSVQIPLVGGVSGVGYVYLIEQATGATAGGSDGSIGWVGNAYVEQVEAGETVEVHSHAIFHILRDLGGPWRAVGWLRFVPRLLTDAGYRTFAAVRYRIFGELDQCRIPQPHEAARFLD